MNLEQFHKTYYISPHLVFSCQYHVVFCTKFRRPVLSGEVAERLKELVWEWQVLYRYKVLEMNVHPYYVHLVLDVDPQKGIYSVVAAIKRSLSRELRRQFPQIQKKISGLWTRNKFIATVGVLTMEAIQDYLAQQKGR